MKNLSTSPHKRLGSFIGIYFTLGIMKHSLELAANKLAKGRVRAFISRVAWLDLEKLVSTAFNEISQNHEHANELGNLYLTKNRDYPPFNQPHLNAFNITNRIQVHAGRRQLNVCHAITESGNTRAEALAESGATLWFSQDVTGSVMVFISPYKSKAMSMNEENIILARYSCASSVSIRDIGRHFATYFRYCSVTSAHGSHGLSGYIYRLRLKYNDFRYANQMRANVFHYIEQSLVIVGSIATLYAGNKFFN